ncbi:hypothetical protein BUALT_Bualt19G0054700 [Buddleja alternifolia]|uniref:AP2/ERF domain-containing protein n=1 Tax=Buddleja alternifolia TaxID=168488 RepID=A0AAV6W9S4_9LAMI|nr:hypothetical protein BUALT_Bualt19G0054700 [Buddleja alternifolia]
MRMKRRCPSYCSSSSSSSSSSSCIEPTITNKIDEDTKAKISVKPKRVRAKKIADNSDTCPKSRSSIYRGAYDNEEDAARTYDLAALKYWGWGPSTILNFPVEAYAKEIEEMEKVSKEEYLASLRRRSSGFSRGVSKYRGVARHHHNGRWEARIGRVSGNKYLYLGTYTTQEEAAAAYDLAAIEFRGPKAVTNFDISNYADKLPSTEVQLVKQDEVQANQQIDPSSFTKVQPGQTQDLQQDEHESSKVVQSSCTNIPNYSSYSQAMTVMDPTEEHDHPWNLCLDIDFNSLLPIPDNIPLDKASDFLGLFDAKGFDDDIECIFDDNDLLQDAMSGTVEGKDLSTSHSSSSLSTIASVCSDI